LYALPELLLPQSPREGVSSSVLGYLAASTAALLPHASLIDGLAISQALEGRWNSPFIANSMGVQQETRQQALPAEDVGKKLVVYTSFRQLQHRVL
jgi:hypothetical protein